MSTRRLRTSSLLVLGLLGACATSSPDLPGAGGGMGSGGTPSSAQGGGGGQASGSGGAPAGSGGQAAPGSGGQAGSAAGTGGASPAVDDAGGAETGAGDTAAPPAAGPGALESVAVPGSGEAVTFKASLAAGEIYLLRASGAVDAGGTKLDAEFAGDADQAGGMDVGIDVGLLQIHAAMGRKEVPPGPGRMKWFGAARADHTYYMLVTGQGKPLSLKLAKAGAATGEITVSLYALSPAPPKLGAMSTELEMVSVPVQKVSNATKLVTKLGAIYLLQAAGAGGVGGGGLKLGDAEYMDWTADGSGKNEGEAGMDFGVGVDEPAVKGPGNGAAYPPRKNWWGPWRMDHIYYLLFVGTGKPIDLAYHDTGYGDNSKTDALTVKIFAAP